MVSVNSTMLPLGSIAPSFTLPDASGQPHSFGELVGTNGTVVAFVCNHCPYVKHVGALLGTLARTWISQGVNVIAVTSNDFEAYPADAPVLMDESAQEWGWEFPYLVDADQSVAIAYHAACTPDFYLFDNEHRLVYRGRLDASTPRNDEPLTGTELDGAIAALLAGKPISEDQRPSIGCNIKWKPQNQPSWFVV